MRHIANIMRPTDSQGTRGELQGEDPVLIREVPFAIETLTGREADMARSSYPDATYKLEIYADPARPVTRDCYLTGGTLGDRKLRVYHIDDGFTVGGKVTLYCGEGVDGSD